MPELIDLDEWLSPAQASRRMHVSERWIREIARKCDWQVLRVGPGVFYARADVAAYRPKPVGRPRVRGK